VLGRLSADGGGRTPPLRFCYPPEAGMDGGGDGVGPTQRKAARWVRELGYLTSFTAHRLEEPPPPVSAAYHR
jgi:hypothetical protein